jgi:hypothetical protein
MLRKKIKLLHFGEGKPYPQKNLSRESSPMTAHNLIILKRAVNLSSGKLYDEKRLEDS